MINERAKLADAEPVNEVCLVHQFVSLHCFSALLRQTAMGAQERWRDEHLFQLSAASTPRREQV